MFSIMYIYQLFPRKIICVDKILLLKWYNDVFHIKFILQLNAIWYQCFSGLSNVQSLSQKTKFPRMPIAQSCRYVGRGGWVAYWQPPGLIWKQVNNLHDHQKIFSGQSVHIYWTVDISNQHKPLREFTWTILSYQHHNRTRFTES